MDKQTFSSIQATTNTSRYAAAVFHKGPTLFFNARLVFLSPCFIAGHHTPTCLTPESTSAALISLFMTFVVLVGVGV